MLGDQITKKRVALARAVALERLRRRHLVDRLVHGFDDGFREWFGDISDAQANNFGVGMLFGDFTNCCVVNVRP